MIPPNNSISSGSLFDPNSFQLQNYNRISIVRLSLQVLPEIIKFYKEKGYEFRVYNDEGLFRLCITLQELSYFLRNVLFRNLCNRVLIVRVSYWE